MEVRNKIWEEFKQARANVICIRKYTSFQRQWNCIYHVFIATTAAVGTVVSGFHIEASVYALGAIAIVSLVKAIFPQILQSEQELCILDSLMDYYNCYMNKMEKLFYQLDTDQQSDDEVMGEIFKLKEEECSKESQINKLVRWIPYYMQKKIDEEVNTYINEVYYDIYQTKSENKKTNEL